MKSSRVQGFTLIELLIVLAVLGLLSAFAMSLYRDYVRRTHVGEGIQLATAARNALGETHGIYGYIYKNVAQGNKDRKSTRLNSSHVSISYAVFCLKKKTHN